MMNQKGLDTLARDLQLKDKFYKNYLTQEYLKMQIGYCPVLRPTIQEFSNFKQYVENLDKKYKDQWGMVKVIPPPEWKPRTSSYKEALDNLTIYGPIEQNIFGKGGVYECLHIQKKSLTLKQYRLKTGVFDRITEGLDAEEVEKMFWKNVVFSPPLYGADLLNTLMEDCAGEWNLNKLDTLLKSSMDNKVRGVNTPYCYIGSWKTLFCWHKEDLDLSAINYLHEGKSKFWYSIPQSQGWILENEAKRLFPEHFGKCEEFLRHKTTLINPYNLKRKYPELKISKVEHKKGEFICVFGGAYHCGFNFGCNIAEAVNYGTLDWLKQITKTKPCKCSKSSVKASLLEVFRNLEPTTYSQSKEFSDFRDFVYDQVEAEESEEDSTEVKAIKSAFTKKIQKNRKLKKISFKGEEYQIDKWAQCDKCKLWRKTKKQIKNSESFSCKNIGKKCHSKDRVAKNYITL